MWDLIVSVPDHCLFFYFLLEMDNIRWSYNIYFLGSIKTDGVIIFNFMNKIIQTDL